MRVLASFLFFSSAALAQATPASPTPRISGGVMAGQVSSRVAPVYPQEAKDAQISGTVVLHAVIGKDGLVQNVSVISGPAALRDAAANAVKQWIYKPDLLNGQPTDVDTTINVNFSLGPTPPNAGAGDMPQLLPAGRYRVSSGVIAGNKISGVVPNFCQALQGQKGNTTVTLHVVIDNSGTVTEASALTGAQVLRDLSADAVRTWVYKPYLLNGNPVEVDTTVTIGQSCGS